MFCNLISRLIKSADLGLPAIMRAIAVILVSTSLDRGAYAPRVPFAAPPAQAAFENDSQLNGHVMKPSGEAPNDAREARALPSHLFWTWFIDNPSSPIALDQLQ
jgi:hypothetical protein